MEVSWLPLMIEQGIGGPTPQTSPNIASWVLIVLHTGHLQKRFSDFKKFENHYRKKERDGERERERRMGGEREGGRKRERKIRGQQNLMERIRNSHFRQLGSSPGSALTEPVMWDKPQKRPGPQCLHLKRDMNQLSVSAQRF